MQVSSSFKLSFARLYVSKSIIEGPMHKWKEMRVTLDAQSDEFPTFRNQLSNSRSAELRFLYIEIYKILVGISAPSPLHKCSLMHWEQFSWVSVIYFKYYRMCDWIHFDWYDFTYIILLVLTDGLFCSPILPTSLQYAPLSWDGWLCTNTSSTSDMLSWLPCLAMSWKTILIGWM